MNKRKAQSDLEELQADILECSICSERYQLPDKPCLSLICGHTYCKKCISDMLILNQQGILCPDCRRPQPYKNVEDVPPNYALQKLLRPTNKNDYKCQTHQQVVCDVYCIDCVKLICTKCLKDHKNHDIADYEDFIKQDEKNQEEAVILIEMMLEQIKNIEGQITEQHNFTWKGAGEFDKAIKMFVEAQESFITDNKGLKNAKLEFLKRTAYNLKPLLEQIKSKEPLSRKQYTELKELKIQKLIVSVMAKNEFINIPQLTRQECQILDAFILNDDEEDYSSGIGCNNYERVKRGVKALPREPNSEVPKYKSASQDRQSDVLLLTQKINELKKQIRCSECDMFNKEYILPCGHMKCFRCSFKLGKKECLCKHCLTKFKHSEVRKLIWGNDKIKMVLTDSEQEYTILPDYDSDI